MLKSLALFPFLFLIPFFANAQKANLKTGIVTSIIGGSVLMSGAIAVGVGFDNGIETGQGRTKVIAGSAVGAIGLAGLIVGVNTIVKSVSFKDGTVATISPSTNSLGLLLTYHF